MIWSNKQEAFQLAEDLKIANAQVLSKLKSKENQYWSIVTLGLFFKATIIYSEVVKLLQEKKPSVSAYLVRGLIEIWADMEYLRQLPQGDLIKFIQSGYDLYTAKTDLAVDGTFRTIPKKERWDNQISITQRIKRLGNNVYFAYDDLSYFTHSSSANLVAYERKDEEGLVKEQLFLATHACIKLIGICTDNHSETPKYLTTVWEGFKRVFMRESVQKSSK